MPGTVLGCLFLRSVIDGIAKIIKTGADVYEGLIVGIVVVLAVAFSQWRASGRRGKQFFAGALGSLAIVTLALLAGTLVTLVADPPGGLVASRRRLGLVDRLAKLSERRRAARRKTSARRIASTIELPLESLR